VEAVIEALEKAAHNAASYMTTDLRHRALEAGWHPEVAGNLNVTFDGKSFTAHVHPDYKERAFEHEFGSETQRGTAVLRKFANQHADGERSFMLNFHNHMRGLK
jgi:hypothetical protein